MGSFAPLKQSTVKMKVLVLLSALAAIFAVAQTEELRSPVFCNPGVEDSVYNYSTTLLDGKTVFHFSELQGKHAVFIPSSNYDDRAAANQVAARDLAVQHPNVTFIMFSTSQFKFGEVFTKPSEFYNVLKYVRPGNGFVPPSNMFYTLTADINGMLGTPVFTQYLTRACGYTRPEFRTDITNHMDSKDCSKTNPSIDFINDVRNPFEAFVIDSHGGVIQRFDAVTDIPSSMFN